MVPSVSALSDKIRYQIDPCAPQNAIQLTLDAGQVITVASQTGSEDLVEVLSLPSIIRMEVINRLMGDQRFADLSVGDVAGLSFRLDRYRCRIGTRPIIHAFRCGEFLRVFIPRLTVVSAEWVYHEEQLAS